MNHPTNHEAVRSSLDALLRTRFPQAVLLQGGDFATRQSLAFHVAQTLLCTAKNAPCGACNACLKMQHQAHPDYIVLQQEQGSEIKIDTARDLRGQASVLPNDGARKVFVIHEANCMNASAQNALLKTLEEPPAYAFFVLTCTQAEGLLETIRSRCISFLLPPVVQNDAETVDFAPIEAFLQALAKADECALLQASMRLEKMDKSAFRASLGALQTALRDAVMAQTAPALLPALAQATQQLSSRITAPKLLAVYDHCALLRQRCDANAMPALQCTALCAGTYDICYPPNI